MTHPNEPLKIGDAVKTPGGYDGYVVEFGRYGQTGTVCVYIDWDGDGIYQDYDPATIEKVSVGSLKNVVMRQECLKFRQKHYVRGVP
jgi:hypothetical protein